MGGVAPPRRAGSHVGPALPDPRAEARRIRRDWSIAPADGPREQVGASSRGRVLTVRVDRSWGTAPRGAFGALAVPPPPLAVTSPFETFVALPRFPIGRRIVALRGVLARLDDPALSYLANRTRLALMHDEAALLLQVREREPAKAGPTQAEAGLINLDEDLDSELKFMVSELRRLLESSRASSEKRESCRRVLERAFPRGASALTKLSPAQQSQAVGELVKLCRGELAADVERSGLGPSLDTVEELNESYTASVQAVEEEASDAGFRAADAAGQLNLVRVVVSVLGHFGDGLDASEHRAAAVLEPVGTQLSQIRTLLTTDRTVTDIDPTAPARST